MQCRASAPVSEAAASSSSPNILERGWGRGWRMTEEERGRKMGQSKSTLLPPILILPPPPPFACMSSMRARSYILRELYGLIAFCSCSLTGGSSVETREDRSHHHRVLLFFFFYLEVNDGGVYWSPLEVPSMYPDPPDINSIMGKIDLVPPPFPILSSLAHQLFPILRRKGGFRGPSTIFSSPSPRREGKWRGRGRGREGKTSQGQTADSASPLPPFPPSCLLMLPGMGGWVGRKTTGGGGRGEGEDLPVASIPSSGAFPRSPPPPIAYIHRRWRVFFFWGGGGR